jgi:hypothetical protein
LPSCGGWNCGGGTGGREAGSRKLGVPHHPAGFAFRLPTGYSGERSDGAFLPDRAGRDGESIATREAAGRLFGVRTAGGRGPDR